MYKSYVSVNFVVGKSEIAPYKETLTVPKLELIAACLSVRLVQTALKELCLKDCNVFYWVDAMSVLHLVASEDKRLALIRQYSLPSQWQFCPTALNAADVGTRSSGMAHLQTWINGPSFLSRLELENFAQPGCRKSEVVLAAFVSEVSEPPLLALVNHYSDLHRLLRAVAIIHRLRKLLQNKAYQSRFQQGLSTEKDETFNPQVGSGVITAVELKNAERDICRVVQSLEFDYLVKYLTDGTLVRDCKSKLKALKKLSPFLDSEGVGGRLQRSSYDYSVKHPILLPKRSDLTRLIVVFYHKMLRHSGYSRVLGRIRQKFWIANGVSPVRFYLKDCVFCDFRRAREGKQLMASLPIERITSGGRPFEVTELIFGARNSFLLTLVNRGPEKRSSGTAACLRVLLRELSIWKFVIL